MLAVAIISLLLIRSLEESELDLLSSGKSLPENSIVNFENEAISVLIPVPPSFSSSSSASSSISSQFDHEEIFVSSLENVTTTTASSTAHVETKHTRDNLHSDQYDAEHESIDSAQPVTPGASFRNTDDHHSSECPSDSEPEKLRSENVSTDASGDVLVEVNNTIPVIIPKSPPKLSSKDEQQESSIPSPAEQHEDIPSFREWTEKHLAEERKERGDNNTNISSTAVKRKTQQKNFASLDCGAKVVAVNPEAKSAGSLLSPTRDEYLLSACNSRIWFVVELCEAVQVETIELANFELFSSSPREFSVSVSDRFPSRDWSVLAHLEAKDEKSVQSFNLQATHFTKYIKVEINSHYGQEHFCPISLFRVYGTSELEILETVDDHPEPEESDAEDEYPETPPPGGSAGEKDIFGSARDAVINMVRKAAEVLVHSPSQHTKPADSDGSDQLIKKNKENAISKTKDCVTPRYHVICSNCTKSLFSRVYETISCDMSTLDTLLSVKRVFQPLRAYRVCSRFGISLSTDGTRCHPSEACNKSNYDTYSLRFLSKAFLASICNLMAYDENNKTLNSTIRDGVQQQQQQFNYNNRSTKAVRTANDQHPHLNVVPNTASVVPNYEDNNYVARPPVNTPTAFNTVSDTIVPIPSTDSSIDQQPSMVAAGDQIKPTKTFTRESHRADGLDSNVTINDEMKTNLSSTDPIKTPVTHTHVPHSEDNDTAVSSSNKDSKETENTSDITEDSSSIDSLISELERTEEDSGHPSVPVVNTAAITNQKPQVQKESVFVRLANRIKTLERNMSLSGQYLEQLSRRYKKQVEDMQRLLSDVSEERQRSKERDEQHTQQIGVLVEQIGFLTLTVNSLISQRDSWSYKALMFGEHSIIATVEVLLLIAIVILCRGLPSVEISKRKISVEWNQVQNQKRLNANNTRRQSADNVIIPQNSKNHKRRPSEVALGMDGSTHQDLLITDSGANHQTKTENRRKRRKRKELLLKSSANALNLETGNHTICNAPSVTNCSTIQRCQSEIFHRAIDNNDNSINEVAALTDRSDNSRVNSYVKPSTSERINFACNETAMSLRRKRNAAATQVAKTDENTVSLPSTPPTDFDRRHNASLNDDSNDRRGSSAPPTPVAAIKEKRISIGFKKVVKRFF